MSTASTASVPVTLGTKNWASTKLLQKEHVPQPGIVSMQRGSTQVLFVETSGVHRAQFQGGL